MRVQVQKWGNSLALRIPKPFAEDTKVKAGTLVDLSVSEGRLVVVPVLTRKVTLKQLLIKVHKDNLHEASDSGPPMGRESW